MRHRVLVSEPRAWVDPADVFGALFRDSEYAFWLDSGANAQLGVSYLGTASRTVTASVSEATVTDSASGDPVAGTVFDFLGSELSAGVEGGALAGPFRLGWVGWLGYELHSQTLGTPAMRQSPHPDAALMFVDRAIAFDHAERTVSLLALGAAWAGEIALWRERVERAMDALVRQERTTSGGAKPTDPSEGQGAQGMPDAVTAPTAEWAQTDEEYLDMIRRCQHHIAEGEAYQLCLTTQARVEVRTHPFDTYVALRAVSPSHHGAFIRWGDTALLSASPEQFLVVEPDGTIESKPIKGTRRRGATPDEDAALEHELVTSEKERAENLMIVDLVRNDIGRVSEVGSVSVTSLLSVESYAQVHQLVSTVRGRLAPGRRPIDAVTACFPAGSMTGAPKHNSVLLLDGLERRPRGVYSGVFGYFGLDGRIDLAMVIRSIVLDADGATIGAGGGITALSDPVEELDEVKLKAAVLLGVLGAVAS